VTFTLTSLVKTNGKDQIESFLQKLGSNWDKKLEDQLDISWPKKRQRI